MLHMVIGRFRSDAGASGSARPAGVSLTESSGLTHIGSWVEATLGRCFQVVECSDVAALHQWAARWRHRVDLEIVPILPAQYRSFITRARQADPFAALIADDLDALPYVYQDVAIHPKDF